MRKALVLLLLIPFACFGRGRVDSLLHVAQGMRAADTGLVPIYIQVAWAYAVTGDTVNTLHYFRESRNTAQSQHFEKGELEASNNIGLYYTRYGAIDSAVAYFLQAYQVAKAMNNQDAAAKSCLNIAGAYLSGAHYAEAIQYYLEALQYLEKLNNPQRIAVNYHCIGIAYYLLKNYSLGLQYYHKSLAVGISTGRPDESGYNYNGIGVVYKELHLYDSALYYLDKAHADAERNKDIYLLSHNLSDKGEVYTHTGRSADALVCLTAALGMHRQLSDQRGVAETYVLLGDVYMSNNNFARAARYYDTARTMAASIGIKDVLKNAWKGLSASYRGLDSYSAALDAFEHYADLKDTLYTEESSRQVAEMQTKYNTEKKEKENLQLQKENALQSLQTTRERNQKYILAISLAFLVATGSIYYNRYRLKQNNKLLKERELRAYAVFQAQEDEKVKLSKDLHDGVGATLALIKLNISSITADGNTEKILTSTKKLASDAIKEVRGISHDLMPSVLVKAGLDAALTEMVEQVQLSGTIDLQLDYGLDRRLTPEAERNLFRIIQEATNNIIKHSGADKAGISVKQSGSDVVVSIIDNGRGFDKARLDSISGNGLDNIYSRAGLMKGGLDIVTGEGSGTNLIIVIPYNS